MRTLAAAMALVLVTSACGGGSDSAELEASRWTVPTRPQATTRAPATAAASGNWEMDTIVDQMDGDKTYVHYTVADRRVESWLGKWIQVRLLLWCSNEPMVSISTMGSDLDKNASGVTSIRIKFDDETSSTYKQDRNDYVNSIYISQVTNHDAFVKRLLRASTLTVELTPFNADSQVVKFELTGIERVVSELRKTCGF